MGALMSGYLVGLRVATRYGIGTVVASHRTRLRVLVNGRTVKVWPGEVKVLGRA